MHLIREHQDLVRDVAHGERRWPSVAAKLEVSGKAADRTELDRWITRLDLGPLPDEARRFEL